MRAIFTGLTVVAGLAGPAAAEVSTFFFASVGQSYSAAIFSTDPRVGQEVVETRIYLDLMVNTGSDAADFSTDLLLPVDPFGGNTNVIVLTGAELGWSGSGLFHYELTTTMHNGSIVAARFGGETTGVSGQILEGSRIEVEHVPAPAALPLAALGAAGLARRRRGRDARSVPDNN